MIFEKLAALLSEQFGVDVDSRENLIAANHSLEEMRGILGVDSLGFLSVEGVKQIAENCRCDFCILQRLILCTEGQGISDGLIAFLDLCALVNIK